MDEITRFGAYGVIVQDEKILLIRKKSGPYKGLWDLPGGGVEPEETSEEALKRELLEESALSIAQFEFAMETIAVAEYEDRGGPYRFHHIGMIYKITHWTPRPDLAPEEENYWIKLSDLDGNELTPFAKDAVCSLI